MGATRAAPGAGGDVQSVREALLVALIGDLDKLMTRAEGLREPLVAAAERIERAATPLDNETIERMTSAVVQLDRARAALQDAAPKYMGALAANTEASKAAVGSWIAEKTNEAARQACEAIGAAARAEAARQGTARDGGEHGALRVLMAAMFGAAVGSAVALAVVLGFLR